MFDVLGERVMPKSFAGSAPAVQFLTAIIFSFLLAICVFEPPLFAQSKTSAAQAPVPLPNLHAAGMYHCADSPLCDSPFDVAFETARQADLQSADPDVVRAARSFGKGVTIEFGDPGVGMQSATRHGIRGDPSAQNGLRAIETVILKPDIPDVQLEAVIGHEGSHVADAQDFVAAISPAGKINQSKNLTMYQTEFRAYRITHAILTANKVNVGYGACIKNAPCRLGFGVDSAQATATINELLANPANRCGVPPNYGITPSNPGPALYELLTPPYLTPSELAPTPGPVLSPRASTQ